MKIIIGSDHAGFPLKAEIVAHIEALGHDVTDIGCHSTESVDFPDIARDLTDGILSGEAARGIMVCGTGVGAAIATNKRSGIRAAVCHDAHSARQCVEHDDVNVLCIGAQIVGAWLARDLVATYLAAEFSTSDEFRRRIAKLDAMDKTRRDGG